MKKHHRSLSGIRNSLKPTVTRISNSIGLRINALSADEPAEIMLYDEIGKDPWTGDGITASDFKTALDSISPKGRQINLRINSPGGLVSEGLAIHNMIAAYPGRTVAIIDGIAASTASFIPMACDEIHMPKTAQMFIHDAWGMCVGPAADMESAADDLNTCSDQIASMYSEKNGKTVSQMRKMMRDETLMTGETALAAGLVDKLVEKAAIRNFTTSEITSMKAKLRGNANNRKTQENDPQIMKRTQMIALLNKFKVAFQDSMTDEQLLALIENMTPPNAAPQNQAPPVADEVAAMRAEMKLLKEADATAKKQRITNAVQLCIDEDRIPAAMRDSSIALALTNEAYLSELQKIPSRPPGTAPIFASLEIPHDGETDTKSVCKFIVENSSGFTKKFIGNNAGRIEMNRKTLAEEISNRACASTKAFRRHEKAIRDHAPRLFNANTIDAELQRTVILQAMLRAYQIVLLPLKNFCTVFNNVPLEGTDKIAVPYFPLQTNASRSFTYSGGYITTDGTVEQVRDVKVGGAGDGSTPPANTWYDRLYQGAQFTSYEQARQPYLDMEQLFVMNAQKLAVDVFTAIVSHVITAGNYGAPVKATPAAAFSGSDIADLYGTATGLNWPALGRSLTLNHPYNVALLKDPSFKYALNYGGTDPIRKAQIQEAYGFQDIAILPNASNYSPAGENLQGWLTHMSAMLCATSPIMPSPEVMNLLTRYDVVADPQTGIAFEYRRFGSADFDATKEVVECSFGASVGVNTALARITSQ